MILFLSMVGGVSIATDRRGSESYNYLGSFDTLINHIEGVTSPPELPNKLDNDGANKDHYTLASLADKLPNKLKAIYREMNSPTGSDLSLAEHFTDLDDFVQEIQRAYRILHQMARPEVLKMYKEKWASFLDKVHEQSKRYLEIVASFLDEIGRPVKANQKSNSSRR